MHVRKNEAEAATVCRIRNDRLYMPEIDGLRALAVVAVILNHFDRSILPSGYLGVDVFFVISGFVITASLLGHGSAPLFSFLTEFYSRRVRRLVPALVAFVVTTSLLICLFDPNPEASLKTGIAAVFGLSNLYLWKSSVDYFATSTQLNVFTHTWSLGVEEQFYLVFPLVVWLSCFARPRSDSSRLLSVIITILSFASLLGFIVGHESKPSAAYFLMPARLWELGAGSLLFLNLKRIRQGFSQLPSEVATLMFAAVVVAFFAPTRFVMPATISAVCLTVALIASLERSAPLYSLLVSWPMIFIGKMSYSLYLWHWGVLAISRWTIGVHWWTMPVQVALMLGLAHLSYRYVERPFRDSERFTSGVWPIGYGIAATLCAAVVGMSLIALTPKLYSGRTPQLAAMGVASLTEPYRPTGSESSWNGEKCVLSENSQVGKNLPLEECTLGNFFTANRRVLVLGNSFSAAFARAFDDLVMSDGFAVTITSAWGASAVKEIPNSGAWDKANYYYWETVAPALMAQLKHSDWVFLVNDMAEFSPQKQTKGRDEKLLQLETGLERLARDLAVRGVRLAVLHGLPFAREAKCHPIAATKQWFSPFGSPCRLPAKSASLVRRAELDEVLVSLQQRGLLRVVDLFDVFCADQECTYYSSNGQMLYRDEWSHPSVEAARLSSRLIRDVLTAAE